MLCQVAYREGWEYDENPLQPPWGLQETSKIKYQVMEEKKFLLPPFVL